MKKILIIIVSSVLFFIGILFFMPNVLKFKDKKFLYIKTGTNLEELYQQLNLEHIIKYPSLFKMVAGVMNLNDQNIHPGKYKINNYCSNFSLVSRILFNRQDKVEFTFKSVRTSKDLFNLFYKNLECDSTNLHQILYNNPKFKQWHVDSATLLGAFVKQNLSVDWNTPVDSILDLLRLSFDKFWNSHRVTLAGKLGLNPQQVLILSSIVQKEIAKKEEASRIAGVYLNRLKNNMRLEADPTVVFANNDFSINRVTDKHLSVISPYNTYKNKGLPPGPICFPDQDIIDNTLNAEKHDFLFFCADVNKNGFHKFTKDFGEHKLNSDEYHQSLDLRGIKK